MSIQFMSMKKLLGQNVFSRYEKDSNVKQAYNYFFHLKTVKKWKIQAVNDW